jgi:predicted RNA-binding Zn-ribbon protein involved in translation (DUF1610 family)
MAEVIQCPSCRRRLLLPPTLEGANVQCPACGRQFIAGQEPPRPAPPVLELAPPVGEWKEAARTEAGASRAPPVQSREWRGVRTGIDIVRVSAALLLGAVLLCSCGVITAETRRVEPEGPTVLLLKWLGLAWLASEVLTLIGYGFCQSAPSANGTKALARLALTLGVSGLLCSLGSGVLLLDVGARRAGEWSGCSVLLGLLGSVLFIGRVYAFLFFLRAVARLREAPGIVQSLHGLMILMAVVLAGYFFLAFVTAARLADSGARFDDLMAFVGCGCIEAVLVLVASIWYIGMLIAVRRLMTVPGS